MNGYYCLSSPDVEKLWGSATAGGKNCREGSICPVEPGHSGGKRIWKDLSLYVRHNHREERIIWTWSFDCVLHQRVLEEFERRGFSGYRLRPAEVRFRDGRVSREYQELVVTGWAGMAHPDSGVRMIKSCPGCIAKSYSEVVNPTKLVDWNRWTGEDFFLVWPLGNYVLITERVSSYLRAAGFRSAAIKTLEPPGPDEHQGYGPIPAFGIPPGRPGHPLRSATWDRTVTLQ